jgi:carotenoid cleavage dioxygenase-like enzyme
MLHSIHFDNGKATYINRFVQTEKLIFEKKYGKSFVFGLKHIVDPYAILVSKIEKFFYGHQIDLSVPKVSNTSVVYHSNKLLSLNEGDLPYEMNEKDMSTVICFLNLIADWEI